MFCFVFCFVFVFCLVFICFNLSEFETPSVEERLDSSTCLVSFFSHCWENCSFSVDKGCTTLFRAFVP